MSSGAFTGEWASAAATASNMAFQNARVSIATHTVAFAGFFCKPNQSTRLAPETRGLQEVSMSTRRACETKADGSMAANTAHGSWTGGWSKPNSVLYVLAKYRKRA